MSRKASILGPGQGRSYPMGRMQAVFKADGEEGLGAYSVSEWQRAGFISFNTPGGFEEQAQPIADWLADNPLGDALGG